MACRPDRPTANYTVDFSSADALGYIPVMRAFSGMSGNDIAMPHGRVPLNPIHLPFIQLVDGRRTIREIAALIARDGAPRPDATDVEKLARNVFQNLWRLDFLAMARTPAETRQLSGPVAEPAFVRVCPARRGADDGNRTRLFSLGSRFDACHRRRLSVG